MPDSTDWPEPDPRPPAMLAGLPDPDFDREAFDLAIRAIADADPDEMPDEPLPPPPAPPGYGVDPEPPAGVCKKCGKEVPRTGKRGRQPQYCDEHRPGAKHSGMTEQILDGTDTGAEDPKPPRSGTSAPRATSKSRRDEELARCQANAQKLLEFAAAGLLVFSKDELMQADALDVQAAAPDLAVALRNVAEHEAWLRKLLAGAQGTPRAMAWIALVMTAAGVAVPILLRHEMLPKELEGLAQAAKMGGQIANSTPL
jgi:hypothetical protein